MTQKNSPVRTVSLSLAAASLSLAWAAPSRADVVDLKDGRSFEGKVMIDNDTKVDIDAMIIGIRTRVAFPREEVDKVTYKPLPAGFFEQTPAPDVQVVTQQNLYLTVPIVGVLGKDAYADGVVRALNYAKSHGCKYVVLDVNSTGGSLEEANKIVDVLKAFQNDVRYVAIVQNAVGESLPIALWAQQIFVAPGAKMGGTSQEFKAFAADSTAVTQQILRSHLATETAARSASQMRYPRLVHSMIDPGEASAAWIDDNGAIEVGMALPPGVPKDKVLFQDSGANDQSVVTLSVAQMAELGVVPYSGDIQGLGQQMKLNGWKAESDYGARAMATTTTYMNQQIAADDKQHKQILKRNIDRRKQLNDALQHNLQQARLWDPGKGSYTTYTGSWGWNSSSLMTNDSRNQWRTRTDDTYNYLVQAQRCINELMVLDDEAKRMGLQPTYADGKLKEMQQDITVKQNYLEQFRNRNGL